MQLTFRQIRDLRDRAGLQDMDIEEFARMKQANDTQNDWSFGFNGSSTVKHIGLGLADIHDSIGKSLSSLTGMSQESGSTASRLGSTVALAEGGAAVGSVVPGIGTAIGGLVGAGVGALMGGAETYEQTNSAGAGIAATTLGLALPIGAGKAGGALFKSAARGMGNKMVTNLAGQEVFKNLSPRLFGVAGENLGFATGNVLSNASIGAIAAPKGHKLEAFQEAFSGENLAHSAVIQSLFAIPGTYRAFRNPVVAHPIQEFSPSQQLSFMEMGSVENNERVVLPNGGASKFSTHRDTTIRFDENGVTKDPNETFTQAWKAGATSTGPFGRVTHLQPEMVPHMTPGELETVKFNKVRVSVGGAEDVYRSFMWHSRDVKTGKVSFNQSDFSRLPREKVQTMASINEATNLLYEQSVAIDKYRKAASAADPVLAREERLRQLQSEHDSARSVAIRIEDKLSKLPADHADRPGLEAALVRERTKQGETSRQLDLESEDHLTVITRHEQDLVLAKQKVAAAQALLKTAPKGQKTSAAKDFFDRQSEVKDIESNLFLAREKQTNSEIKKSHFSAWQEAQRERQVAELTTTEVDKHLDLMSRKVDTQLRLEAERANKPEKVAVPTFDGSSSYTVEKPNPTYGEFIVHAVKVNKERAKVEGPLQAVVGAAIENAAKSERSQNPVKDLLLPSQLELDIMKSSKVDGTKTGNTEELFTTDGFGKAMDDLSVFRHLVPEMDELPVSHAEVVNFAQAKRGNSAVEMAQLHYALKMAGLNGAENLKLTSRLLSLWKHKVQFKTFEGAVEKHGMFTENKGLQEVWVNAMNSSKVKNGLLFTIAHELNGHGIWAAYEKGELPANMSKSLTEFVKVIQSNSEKENTNMLREVFDGLPKELKRDVESNDLLNIKGKNHEEVLANFNAIVSLSMASASQRQQGLLAMAAPGPIRPVLSAMARFSKGVMDSLNTARKTSMEQIEYGKALTEFFKIDNLDAQAKELALQLNGIQDGGQWHEMFQQNNARIANMMKQPGTDQVVKFLEISANEKSRWYDRLLMPIQLFSQKFPVMRKLIYTFQERQNAFNRYQTEHFELIGLKRENNRWKATEGGDYYQVAQSQKMSEALKLVTQRANKLESRVSDNMSDPEIASHLAKLSKDEQGKVMNTISLMEQLQQKNVSVVRDMRYDDLANLAALVAMKKGVHSDSETALGEAKQYINDFRTKGSSSIKPVYEELVAQQMQRYEEDFNTHSARPWYVSQQRFSEFKFRAIKKDSVTGKLREEFNGDANTEGELLAMMKQRKSDGWEVKRVEPTSGLRSHKELLTGLLAQEQAQATYLRESLSLVIKDPIEVESMMQKFNMAELLVKEVAAQEKPMSLHRKGVDGFQGLDVIKQQILSVDVTGRALTKKIAKSQFELFASDPKVANHESLDYVRQAFTEFLTPDNRLTKKVNSFNYAMFMSAHFLNMVQDGLAPLIGVLPSNLFNEGSTMTGAYGKVLRGMSKAMKNPEKLSRDEQMMLDEFEKNNDALSLYTDGANNDVMAAINARRSVEGKPLLNAAQFLSDKGSSMFATVKGWHGAFTHYGHKATALALFEHFTEQGMKFEAAKKATFESLAMNTFAGGKANRVGLMAPGKLQPAAAMLLGLQNFALGTMFTAKNHFSKAFLRSGFTTAERGRAIGALGMQMGMLWAVAGLFGMPGIGPATKVLQDQFGVNAKLDVEDFFEDELGIKGSLATEGLINSISGYDVASRSGVPGLFGLNDRSNEISAFGPTGAIAARLYGVGSGTQDWQDMLPHPLNRLISMARDGGDFRDSKGSLLEEGNMESNLIYGLFGVKPTSVREKQDYKALVFSAEKNEQRRREQFEREAVDALERGENISDTVAAFQMAEEAKKSQVESQLQRISSPELLASIASEPTRSEKPKSMQQKQAPIYRGISDTLFKRNNFAAVNRPVQDQRELFMGGKLELGGFAR